MQGTPQSGSSENLEYVFFLFIQEIYYQSNYKELIKKNLINIF